MTSFELDAERAFNVDSSIRAYKGVLLLSSLYKSLTELALRSKDSSDKFISMDTTDIFFLFFC